MNEQIKKIVDTEFTLGKTLKFNGKKIEIDAAAKELRLKALDVGITLTTDEAKEYFVIPEKEDTKAETLVFQYLKDHMDEIPLRFYWEGQQELIILYIRDVNIKLVASPEIYGSSIPTYKQKLYASKYMERIVNDILKMLISNGKRMNGLEICEEIINFVVYRPEYSPFFRINQTDFSTFSFDLDKWKCGYLDEYEIDTAPDELTHWGSFKNNINNNEAWTLFCAWVWGIFNQRCSSHNRQALWLYGDGYDGKSVISRTISRIITNNYDDASTGTSTISEGTLYNQFWASGLYGKSFIVVNEVKDPTLFSNKTTGGKLHQVTGHDLVSIEPKGQQYFSAPIWGRVMIHSNCAPEINTQENNQLTRIIPVKIEKSYFKGLHNFENHKDISFDWEKALFEERWSFLKTCKSAFSKIYNNQDLFAISTEYQSLYFNEPEYVSNAKILFDDVKQSSEVYAASDISQILKFVALNIFGFTLTDRMFSKYMDDKNIRKERISINGERVPVRKCSIKNEWLEQYNRSSNNNREIKPLISKEEIRKSSRFEVE